MFHHLSIIGALAWLFSCAPAVTEPRREVESPTILSLAAEYETLQPAVADARGWTDADRCDALLWAGLRAASGIEVDVAAAEAGGGRWYRRPVFLPECLAAGGSDSTISRDMLLGVLWWAWSHNRTDEVEALWDYGVKHAFIMGEGNPGAVLLHGNLLTLTARLCVRLSGNCPGALPAALAPLVYADPAPRGYRRHLEVLQILLAAEIDDGKLPSILVDQLARHAAEQPANPLYALAAALYHGGNPGDVDALLLPWPRGRLPMSSDWCSSWVVEAEDSESGALPCDDGRIHSGGEILFLRRVLLGK